MSHPHSTLSYILLGSRICCHLYHLVFPYVFKIMWSLPGRVIFSCDNILPLLIDILVYRRQVEICRRAETVYCFFLEFFYSGYISFATSGRVWLVFTACSCSSSLCAVVAMLCLLFICLCFLRTFINLDLFLALAKCLQTDKTFSIW